MKLAFEMISNEQNSETATFGPYEINSHVKNEFQTNNVQQHLAIANWAMERYPPFGVGKKTLLQKEIRKEKRERKIYFIGDTEKDILATLKELKALGKELANEEKPRACSAPSTPRIKCRKIKTLSKRIRDKKD